MMIIDVLFDSIANLITIFLNSWFISGSYLVHLRFIYRIGLRRAFGRHLIIF